MIRLKSLGNVVLAFLLLAGLSAMPAAAQGKRDSGKSQARLSEQVRHELAMLPYYTVFDWIAYDVKGDHVTLMGQVTRPTLKDDAAGVLKHLEGVASVTNRIEVLPLSPYDDQIRRGVFFALYGQNSPLFHYGVGGYKGIHIIVRNGNVTLVGFVNSETDKNLAYIRASSVPGSFSVTNELKVEKG